MRRRSISPVASFLTSGLGISAIAWVIVFSSFLVFVFVKAVVLGQPARYFSSLLQLTFAYVVFASLLAEGWERFHFGHRWRDDPGDWRSRLLVTGVIGLIGMVVVALIMFLLLIAGGVWTPATGMVKPAAAGGNGEPTPGAFAPGDRKAPVLRGEPGDPGRLPNLIAHWRFDEGEGNRAADGSGHGHIGIVHGARWVRGVRGQALWFDAQDAWFDFGNSPAFNFDRNAPFSITGWIQTEAAAGTVVSLRNSRDGGPDIEISLNAGRLGALVREDGGEFGEPARVAGPDVHDGLWHHFALTRKAGGEIELFVDGSTQGKNAAPHSAGPITTNLRSAAREQYWLTVRHGPGLAHWNGCLDDFAIFSRALSETEVRGLAGLP
jgi:hypothetical protein